MNTMISQKNECFSKTIIIAIKDQYRDMEWNVICRVLSIVFITEKLKDLKVAKRGMSIKEYH